MLNVETKVLALYSFILSPLFLVAILSINRKFKFPKMQALISSIIGGSLTLAFALISWEFLNFVFKRENYTVYRTIIEWYNGQGNTSWELGMFAVRIIPIWPSAFAIAFFFGFITSLLISVGSVISKKEIVAQSKHVSIMFFFGLACIVFSLGVYYVMCSQATALVMTLG